MSDETASEGKRSDKLLEWDQSGFSAELLSSIPSDRSEDVTRAIIAYQLEIRQVERYSGILPHPSIMERIEIVLPGSADRILHWQKNAKLPKSFRND